MRVERLQVLQMLKDDKITVAEANSLLEALETPSPPTKAGVGGGRTLRVRVVEEGKQRVNVSLPLGLVRIASRWIPQDLLKDSIDWDNLVRAVEEGARGKLVELSDEDGSLVEVYVQ